MAFIDILKTILIYLVIFLIIYLFLQIFQPILRFKPIMDWWKESIGDTTDPDYEQFDLTSLAYWEYFPLYYYVRILTTSERYRFQSPSWVYFITSLIYGGGKGLVDGGYVTPKDICKTLVPDDWQPSSGNMPESISDWRSYFKNWGITYTDNPKKYTADANTWNNATDNFLFKTWAIPYDSPIVKAFVTNWSNDEDGQPLYPSAMEPLLGFKNGISASGWFGFLQAGEGFSDMGVFEIKRLVWSDDVPSEFNGRTGVPKDCGSGSSIAGFLSAGIGAGIGGAMLGPVLGGTLGLGPLGWAIGLGLLFGGGAAVASAGAQGCL
jgi:hypothetical protein